MAAERPRGRLWALSRDATAVDEGKVAAEPGCASSPWPAEVDEPEEAVLDEAVSVAVGSPAHAVPAVPVVVMVLAVVSVTPDVLVVAGAGSRLPPAPWPSAIAVVTPAICLCLTPSHKE